MAAERVAVVTGAAKGIGRAIAERLAADGLQVTGLDVDAERLAGAEAELGPALQRGHVLHERLRGDPTAELRRQLAVNFESAFFCCRLAIRACSAAPA